jgi:hypothetical protein
VLVYKIDAATLTVPVKIARVLAVYVNTARKCVFVVATPSRLRVAPVALVVTVGNPDPINSTGPRSTTPVSEFTTVTTNDVNCPVGVKKFAL